MKTVLIIIALILCLIVLSIMSFVIFDVVKYGSKIDKNLALPGHIVITLFDIIIMSVLFLDLIGKL